MYYTLHTHTEQLKFPELLKIPIHEKREINIKANNKKLNSENSVGNFVPGKLSPGFSSTMENVIFWIINMCVCVCVF